MDNENIDNENKMGPAQVLASQKFESGIKPNTDIERSDSKESTLDDSETLKKTTNHFVSPVRTFSGDINGAMKNQNVSYSKIIAAEQNRTIQTNKMAEFSDSEERLGVIKKIFFGISIIILGLGIIYGVFYYLKINQKQIMDQPILTSNDNITNRESIVRINVSDKLSREIVTEIRNEIDRSKEMQDNTTKEIILEKTIRAENSGEFTETKQKITAEELFIILESRAPAGLARTFDQNFMLGVYKHDDIATPFIIFKTKDYERTFANMIAWESILIKDVQDIFYQTLGSSQFFIGENIIEKENTSTSTVSATSSIEAKYNAQNFKDVVLENRDTRAILDTDGNILFFYSFIDKEKLILTTDRNTMKSIIKGLHIEKMIR